MVGKIVIANPSCEIDDIEKVFFPLWAAKHAEAVMHAKKEGKKYSAEGAKLIGWGAFGDVWRMGANHIIKIYRRDFPDTVVRKAMKIEWETYQALMQGPLPSPVPTLYAYAELEASANYGECGWAVFSRIPGHHLTYKDLDTRPEIWGRRFAEAATKFETALNAVPHKPASWSERNVKDLAPRLEELFGMSIGSDERKLIDELASYIEREGTATSRKRYLHGDIYYNNALLAGDTLQLFDPVVSFNFPESNLMHFMFGNPDFVKAFAAAYESETGIRLNEKLIWAFGALNGHRVYFIKLHGNPEKGGASAAERDMCLNELAKLDPDWTRPKIN